MAPPFPETDDTSDLRAVSRELLCSLHDSLRRARRASEDYLAQFPLDPDCAPDISAVKPHIAKLEGVIRDIQKVERALVDQDVSDAAASADPAGLVAIDLGATRDEIERCLAGLAAAIHAGTVPE